jgi:hypothetical protein
LIEKVELIPRGVAIVGVVSQFVCAPRADHLLALGAHTNWLQSSKMSNTNGPITTDLCFCGKQHVLLKSVKHSEEIQVSTEELNAFFIE